MARAVVASGVRARARALVQKHVPLPKAIEAHTTRTFEHATAGRVAVYEDLAVRGTPLVLIHGLGVGASSAELAPIFEAFRYERPVVAIDLPGFGGSERALARIDRAMYHDVLADFFTKLVRQHGEAVDVVALSTGAELAATAALRNEELVRSLVLVSPTGFSFPHRGPVDRVSANLRAGRVRKLLFQPMVGRPLYVALSTRAVVRQSLGKFFMGPVNEALLDMTYAMAHQPDAWRAPMVFLSGALTDPEVRDRVYGRLGISVLVVYDGDSAADFEALGGFLRAEPTWSAERVRPSRGMPHFECADETSSVMRRFYSGLDMPIADALGAPAFSARW